MNEKLSELRKKNNLTQEELAEKLNVSRQTISKWELGETSPNISQAHEISKLFNISLDELFEESRENKIRISKIIKGVLFGLLVFFIMIVLYFYTSYKKSMVYNINHVNYNDVKIKDTIELKHKIADEYLEFKNIKIRNDFKDYKEDIRNDKALILKKDNKTFSIILRRDFLSTVGFESGLSYNYYTKFLTKNNINNTIDMLHYALDNKDKEVNLLTSNSKLKDINIVKNTLDYYFGISINSNYDVYQLTGEYRGIIQNNKNGSIIEIIEKDTSYILTINNSDFDYVLDLLSTLVIN